MPAKGITNRIMTSGPWEPKWFRSFNQKSMPNNTEFVFYDYDKMDQTMSMISKEMEKVGVVGAEKAYNLLRPYAFKKDLFEWMALWQYGGLYMDIKMGLMTNISDWIDMDNEEFVLCSSKGSLSMDNAFVAMTRHHPYGLMMVQHIINQVNERAYFDGDQAYENSLNITGPGAVRSEFISAHQLTWANVKCIKEQNQIYHYNETTKTGYTTNRTSIEYLASDPNKKILIQNDPVPEDKVWDKMKECKSHCNDYNELFDNRQVYCDQPGPTEGCQGKEWTSFIDSNTWKHMRSMEPEFYTTKEDPIYYKKFMLVREKEMMHDIDV